MRTEPTAVFDTGSGIGGYDAASERGWFAAVERAAIFLGAFLLFQIQPILGRFALPIFGGGPSVWTTCMLFFQIALVGGYLYAHLIGSLKSRRQQTFLHVAALLLSLLFFAFAPAIHPWAVGASASRDPSLRILLLLTESIAGPYLLLAATSPLLQQWRSRGKVTGPWRLYALSNVGSLLALVSYPVLVEPYLRLSVQIWIWFALYACFVGLSIVLTLCRSSGRGADELSLEPRLPARDIALWFGLACAGSMLLLGTTNELTERVASAPFLWIVPLCLYLLTFVLTFESARWGRRFLIHTGAGVAAVVTCTTLMTDRNALPLREQIAFYLITLFLICMACHGELARSRPSTRHLTAFYLTIAAGGAAGGIFVALIAPRVFTNFTEYPVSIALGSLVILACSLGREKQLVPVAALLAGVVASCTLAWEMSRIPPQQQQVRNFYGVLRVADRSTDEGLIRELKHGPILHGFQFLDEARSKLPTSYYGPHSGAGTVLELLPGARRVAVIGLGAGTMAAWGKRGDSFRFYEINPAIQAIAETRFSYLKDSNARVEVVLGDARVNLHEELLQGQTHNFDVIVVDAFSGDAIPTHLLTAEAADLYKQHLADNGSLLLHISNRSLDLEPVALGMATRIGWPVALFRSGPSDESGESTSRWVLITSNRTLLKNAAASGRMARWGDVKPLQWTDDFASLWPLVKF